MNLTEILGIFQFYHWYQTSIPPCRGNIQNRLMIITVTVVIKIITVNKKDSDDNYRNEEHNNASKIVALAQNPHQISLVWLLI